ncbi:copper resistance protein NlpE [Luteimonas sp. Y-2-2-4F]|nr:copper resistance protein NlpE N-terminal domain-containing protein [Luteimonas sp. Y-2-2-4F]MCD9030951.1 copper resistance protein NlpE [Luteimonas sp. Y-2-2-4F]
MAPLRPVVLLALLALCPAACERGRPPPDAGRAGPAAAAPAAAPAAAADAEAEAATGEPDAEAAGIAQASGTFAGTLPCADCAGIETTLRLHADGGYDLIERPAGEAEPDVHHGVWFVSDDGRAILIASDAGAGDHHIFEWQGEDALRLLAQAPDGAGETEAEARHLLRRTE